MSDLVVGDPNCTFDDIVISVSHCPVSPSDHDLSQLMRLFRTKNDTKEIVMNRDKKKVSTLDSIEIILKEWRSREASNAKLVTFIAFLREIHLNDTADKVWDHWFPSSNESKGSSGSNDIESFHYTVELQPTNMQTNGALVDPVSRNNFPPLVYHEVSIDGDNDTSQSESGHDISIANSRKFSAYAKQNHECIDLVTKQPSDTLRKGKNTKLCQYDRWPFLTLLLLCIIGMPFGGSLVYYKNQNQSYLHINELSDTGQTYNAFGAGKENNHSDSSDLDYIDDMPTQEKSVKQYANHSKLNTRVTLLPILPSNNEALEELIVKNPENLKELFGSEDKWKNLNVLKFDYQLDPNCMDTTDQHSVQKIDLPNLKYLTLNISNGCGNLIDRIIYSVQMTQLKVFNFIGDINDQKVQQIQEFLHRYHKSLEAIHIKGLLNSSIHIFEIRRSFVLKSVTNISIKLDRVEGGSVNWGIINDRFCSLFPHLKKFVTKNIFISVDELFKLQKCSYIGQIDTSVSIGLNENKLMNDLKWQNRFPLLRNIAAKFVFQECPNNAFFEIFKNNAHVFEEYRFCSNCNISGVQDMKCIRDIKPQPLPSKRYA